MNGDCQNWGGLLTRDGYGRQYRDGRYQRAHRVAYAEAYGPIPDGMTVDHLCFNPSCVNPEHLRLLTMSENAGNRRNTNPTHCRNGHPFDSANTYEGVRRDGKTQRGCRACNSAARRRYLARKAS